MFGAERFEKQVPKIPIGYEVWIDAFWQLSSNRNISQISGPIPSLAVDKYADEKVKSEERNLFEYCVREMDRSFVDYVNADKKTQEVMRAKSSRKYVTPEMFDSMFGKK